MKLIWYLDTASKHKVAGSSEVLLSASQVLAQVLQLKFAFIIDLGFDAHEWKFSCFSLYTQT